MADRYTATAAQAAKLQARFGETLDVEREVRQALDYANHFHTGRPYKNVGKFLWNWCLRSEMSAGPRRILRMASAPAGEFPPLTRTALEEMLHDELPQIREMAAEQLKILGLTSSSGQDKD